MSTQQQNTQQNRQTSRIEALTIELLAANLHRDSDIIDAAIATVAKDRLTSDGLIASAILAARNVPQILGCPYESILYGVTLAARTGLPIGPPSRQSDLIPRYSKQLGNWCWWEPSYQGLRTLARRTGVVATFQSEVVYENDRFEYAYGDDDFIRHQPAAKIDGALLYAYTITTFTNGARRTFTVMRRDEVEHVMKSSESWGRDWSPWQKHPAEQWKKTSSKRHCKTLELSEELAIASQAIDHGEIHRIDPMLAELFRRHQLALPESTAELIDLSQDDRARAIAQTPRARGSISMADLKPSENGNRGHGQEGFEAAKPAAQPKASPRSSTPPVEQPRKPEPGAIVSKQGLVQIRQATAAWNRDQQDRFLSEFGIDALEQLQSSVFRKALAWIEAENGGNPDDAVDGPPSVARDFTDEQIAALDATAQQNGLDEGWVRSTLPAWLGLGSKPITAAPLALLGRAERFVEIAALCRKTGSDLTVALEFFRVQSIAELTDAQVDGVISNLKTKLMKLSSPFEGQ